MSLRLRILLSFAVFIALGTATLFYFDRAATTELTQAYTISSDPNELYLQLAVNNSPTGTREWARENLYLNVSHLMTQGPGPLLTTEKYDSRAVSKSALPLRILAIGDSYAYGVGAIDPGMVWPNRLEDLLHKRYPGQSFDVITVAKPGASLMEETEWVTEDFLERVNPDLIIWGLVSNDATPSGRERTICGNKSYCDVPSGKGIQEYTKCLAGNGALMSQLIDRGLRSWLPNIGQSLLLRFCETTNTSKGTSRGDLFVNGPNDPYYDLFLESIARISKIKQKYPLLVAFHLDVNRASGSMENMYKEFRKYGIRTVKTTSANRVISVSDDLSLMVNPSDRHPSGILTTAYALDIIEEMRKAFPSLTSPSSSNLDRMQSDPALRATSFFPAHAEVVSLPGNTIRFSSAPANRYPYDVIEESFPARQETPCAVLGRVHVRLMFNQQAEGTSVTLSELNSDVSVFITGYTADGKSYVRAVGEVAAQTELRTKLSAGDTGILLAQPDSPTCDADTFVPTPTLSFTLTKP